MKDNILITGSAGFIGYHLSQKMCQSNYNVIGIDILNDYYDVSIKKNRLNKLKKYDNFNFIKLDLLNKKDIQKLFHKNNIRFIFHLAAQAGVRFSINNPQAYIDSNITGFLNILEEAKKNKINLIYASSSSVYGDSKKTELTENDNCNKPVSIYGFTKIANELMASTYFDLFKVNSIGLRFFTVYGPFGRPDMAYFDFVKKIINNKSIDVYNNGLHSRSFTYIDDVITSIYHIYKKYKNSDSFYDIINIGGGESVTLIDFIKTIEMQLNKKAKLNFLPKQPGDVNNTKANCKKLNELIDFKPTINLKHGIKEFINWYQKYHKK